MPPPSFTWTGFYAGVNGGYGFGDASKRVYQETDYGLPAFGPINIATDVVPGKSRNGWFGGGQVGYNFQTGPVVLGVEADFQGADISTGRHAFTSVATNYQYVGHSGLDYFGTVRGRIGYAFDQLLVYATGGLAYGRVATSFNYADLNFPGLTASASKNSMEVGYAIGAGLEYAFTPNWSIKAEYQYLNFGSKRLSATETFAGTPTTVVMATREKDIAFHTVRAGLNYRFATW